MSSTSAEFCDTNVIVYACDATAGIKRDQASRLLRRLWESQAGVVSIQVLQEFFVTVTRKVPLRLTSADARAVVADLSTWRVVQPAPGDVLAAIDAADRWQISFWDAMILTAAKKAGASVLWSEDLGHRQDYDGVLVPNPFLAPDQP